MVGDFYVDTKTNVADDPTRNRDVRSPVQPVPQWYHDVCDMSFDAFDDLMTKTGWSPAELPVPPEGRQMLEERGLHALIEATPRNNSPEGAPAAVTACAEPRAPSPATREPDTPSEITADEALDRGSKAIAKKGAPTRTPNAVLRMPRCARRLTTAAWSMGGHL